MLHAVISVKYLGINEMVLSHHWHSHISVLSLSVSRGRCAHSFSVRFNNWKFPGVTQTWCHYKQRLLKETGLLLCSDTLNTCFFLCTQLWKHRWWCRWEQCRPPRWSLSLIFGPGGKSHQKRLQKDKGNTVILLYILLSPYFSFKKELQQSPIIRYEVILSRQC